MKLLTLSTLYPSAVRPSHGVFVENRLRHLLAYAPAESRVVAPVPWFPLRQRRFGEYALFAQTPAREQRHGIDIIHPRYPLLPKVGMTMAPLFLALPLLPVLKRIIARGYDFDVIDAHYFYPDGVAAALLGQWLGKPVVITARGTDLNLIGQFRLPRTMIRWAAATARGLITVCQALKDELVGFGVDAERINVLRNGVDLKLFQPPPDRDALRRSLGMHGPVLLSVGHLIERKGHDLVIGALTNLADVRLYIAGTGPERAHLETSARLAGVADRVTFLGAVSHDQLAQYYGAADVLVLASSREGWANVLLESMACGTPVVATAVWGTPEVVAAPEAGLLAQTRSAESLAQAVKRLLADYPQRTATRRYAEKFSWDDTSRGQWELFSSIVQGTRSS